MSVNIYRIILSVKPTTHSAIPSKPINGPYPAVNNRTESRSVSAFQWVVDHQRIRRSLLISMFILDFNCTLRTYPLLLLTGDAVPPAPPFSPGVAADPEAVTSVEERRNMKNIVNPLVWHRSHHERRVY